MVSAQSVNCDEEDIWRCVTFCAAEPAQQRRKGHNNKVEFCRKSGVRSKQLLVGCYFIFRALEYLVRTRPRICLGLLDAVDVQERGAMS